MAEPYLKIGDITIEWLGHATFRIKSKRTTIYTDPFVLDSNAEKADFILVSHEHYDHCDSEKMDEITKGDTVILAPPSCISKLRKDFKVINPGEKLSGSFILKNIGGQYSLLDWVISENPSWGYWNFTPIKGDDLAHGSQVTVNVEVVAPDEKNKKFTGNITVVNKENISDFCIIDVFLSTPKNKPFGFFHNLLNWLFEHFPHAFPILRYLSNFLFIY